MNNPDSKVLTVREAATMLRLGLNSTYEAIRRGELPALRVGRRLLVPRAALEDLLKGSKEPDGSDVDENTKKSG